MTSSSTPTTASVAPPTPKFVGAELQDTSGKTLVAVAADDTVTIG